MASKPKSKPKPGAKPQVKDLVKVGPRDVFVEADKAQKLREVKPTTSRALVLRNDKLALRGNSDAAYMQRISGREKLDLLAEDLVDRTTKAVSAPFDIHKCLRIAESQYDVSLGEIEHLRDPEMFTHIIQAELEAQTRYDPGKPDPLKNPSYVARVIGTKIHNQYMMASAWRMVGNILRELIGRGTSNKNVKALLKNDNRIRGLYFALFRMVEVMVDINQQRFSGLALNSAHYARYFKQQQSDDPTEEPSIVFDHTELREAGLSFIDSIIIELCFPKAPYPQFVLYRILHEAAEESPKETKRFSQLMWDAIGDLSECVEMQQLLEMPLLTPEASQWKEEMWQMPPEFDIWRDAQMMSLRASEEIGNFKDVVFPLAKTMRKAVLDNMWMRIDQNYFKHTGKDIDELWQLKGELDIEPQWTSFYTRVPKKNVYDSSDDEDDPKDGHPPSRGNKKAKKRLAIANWAADDPDFEGMPELQTVSNSTEDDSTEDDTASEASYLDNESEGEDGYDTEEEEVIKHLVREAMDYVIEKDLFNGGDSPPGPIKVEDERQNNPFLNLLTSLRGRLFKKSAKLHVPTAPPPRARPAQAKKATSPGYKATVEEVTDEEEPSTPAKKKKKKPKKKKKSVSIVPEEQAPLSPTPPPATPPETKSPVSPPSSPTKAKAKKTPTTPTSKTRPAAPAVSAAALPTFETKTIYGESARSYLSSFEPQKEKHKTRSDQASLFSKDENAKASSSGIGGSIMSKLGFGRKKAVMEDKDQKVAQKSWFSKLSTKAAASMHHLLRTSGDVRQGKGGMRWDDFVKLMTEMGFQYDPSTTGSSVRFIPPGSDDHPISVHKPHPKPYLEPWQLRGVAKHIKKRYGWDQQVFMGQAGSFSSDSEKE
ncbi:hypothetical protein D9756_007604 [Leucocoprinus leucothites]|uniref:Uncharacterized protein n=1 Tax=Leucocoprinus leucothites TaxID=201217 RepID=A0A8H5FWN4_9AGAR|nr:hypothetical protein D9756_007604 [Leucoagaricus leucothites]